MGHFAQMDLMLDSDAVTFLVNDPALLAAVVERQRAGTDRFIITGVQPWQKARNLRDPAHAAACARFAAQLERVPSVGFIIGVSELDEDKLAATRALEPLRTGGSFPDTDAVIAATAKREGAVLVTGDKRLTTKAKAANINVWTREELRAYLGHLERGTQSP